MTGAIQNSPRDMRNKVQAGLHPKIFMMLIAMISMTMLFVALTSALIVKKADTLQWQQFRLPITFLYSTIAIVASSVFLQVSYNQYKKSLRSYHVYMLLALICGIVFCVLQYVGWTQINSMGMRLDGNVSGSFVYVVTGFHLVHLIGGVIALLITWIMHSKKVKDPVEELKEILNVERRVNFNALLLFWHFLGGLWVYLFIFLFTIYN